MAVPVNIDNRTHILSTQIRVSTEGINGLGGLLIEAIKERNPECLKWVGANRDFNRIPVGGKYGLGKALHTFLALCPAILEARPVEYLEVIFQHPENLAQFAPKEFAQEVGHFLLAVASDNRHAHVDAHEIFIRLLNPLFSGLSASGPYGLGRILFNACYSCYPQLVQSILKHPLARNIDGMPVQIDELTPAEDDLEFSAFGIPEALYAALRHGGPYNGDTQPRQFEIVQSLLQFGKDCDFSHLNHHMQEAIREATEENPQLGDLAELQRIGATYQTL